MITIEICALMVLLLAVRLLTPKMMESNSAGVRFGIGLGLFAIYTAVCILMFRYLCTFDKKAIAQLSGNEVWTRVICAFLLVNAAAVFAACIFFFTREKRKLSQEEKMKLKDL